MEFDKSRCYSAINADELHVGDKVIVAQHLGNLKYQVSQRDYYVWTITEIREDTYSDRFVTAKGAFPLVYLIERAKNCYNCEGCIACIKPDRTFGCTDWKPKTEPKAEKNTDYNHCEEAKKAYVCAMTNACPNKYCRPFKNTDELVKAWNKKFYLDFKPSHDPLTMPYIWVRQKECNKGGLLITYFGEDEVKTDMGFMTMSKLLSDYTFTDGSPCGVEE